MSGIEPLARSSCGRRCRARNCPYGRPPALFRSWWIARPDEGGVIRGAKRHHRLHTKHRDLCAGCAQDFADAQGLRLTAGHNALPALLDLLAARGEWPS